MIKEVSLPKRPTRKFINRKLIINSWDDVHPYFKELMDRKINSTKELEKWMLDRNELEAILQEDVAWRYIKMNIDTKDENLNKHFHVFIQKISPKIAPYTHQLNIKLIDSPFLNRLDKKKYHIYLRSIKKNIEIFRKENIPLFTKMESKQQEYGLICANMLVEINGKKITMQQASLILKDTNRKKREEIFKKITKRRLEDVEKLDKLFDELINLRQEIAHNANFDNYRDYMFAALGRFDYTPTDCYKFHQAIEKEIVPIITKLETERKEKMKINKYQPWDTQVNADGEKALQPFNGGEMLLDKSIDCFYKLRPYFGECLEIMKSMQHLDLESKKGKSPGGFMYPLYEIGVPFIYMNAVGSQRDLVTMVHEGGHAIHSFLSRELTLNEFKSTPSEVAELASMSMELLSMKYWNIFYDNKEHLKRAKKEQLEKILAGLPWIAAIDKFQHWIYTTDHNAEERRKKWIEINSQLGNQVIQWNGYEETLANQWQQQLHLYEVPFYYIEYGIAQLGAIALWREFNVNEEHALDKYVDALKLGYTKSISEIYKTAGIEFNFSHEYVEELSDFIKKKLSQV